jgi:hypothetical protein
MYSLSTVPNRPSINASYAGLDLGGFVGAGCQILLWRSASFAGEKTLLFRRGCLFGGVV